MNDSQKQIVESLKGGLLVLAPVGTGKTLTLAERAAYAVSQGIAPDRILCLTFTNRAAKDSRTGRQIPSKFAKAARRTQREKGTT